MEETESAFFISVILYNTVPGWNRKQYISVREAGLIIPIVISQDIVMLL